MTTSGDQVIKTRIEYSETFRFNLWLALLEDMDFLGKGYRAYHSHMFESFKKWHAQGVEFQNARGGTLNLDALKTDDLYGFLGKKNQLPKGPKRKIENKKIAVIDAFFQRKYPTSSASFESGVDPVEVASSITSFLSSTEGDEHSANFVQDTVESLDGVLIHNPNVADDLELMLRMGGKNEWGIPVFILNKGPNRQSLVVHKVVLVPQTRYFETYFLDDDDYQPTLFSRLQKLPEVDLAELEVWSGVGVVTPLNTFNPLVQVDCVLRERESKQSHVSSLQVHGKRDQDSGVFKTPLTARTSMDANRSGDFFFVKDLAAFDALVPQPVHTRAFIEDVFSLKRSLGQGV